MLVSCVSFKKRGRADEKKAIVDSLTVEYSRVPGKTFHRKVLSKLSLFFSNLTLFVLFPLYFSSFAEGAIRR
jgi:hypothetical protein